jgi:hypothetical protein
MSAIGKADIGERYVLPSPYVTNIQKYNLASILLYFKWHYYICPVNFFEKINKKWHCFSAWKKKKKLKLFINNGAVID